MITSFLLSGGVSSVFSFAKQVFFDWRDRKHQETAAETEHKRNLEIAQIAASSNISIADLNAKIEATRLQSITTQSESDILKADYDFITETSSMNTNNQFVNLLNGSIRGILTYFDRLGLFVVICLVLYNGDEGTIRDVLLGLLDMFEILVGAKEGYWFGQRNAGIGSRIGGIFSKKKI